MDEKDFYSDYMGKLDESQKDAINGYLELMGGKAELECAMLEGELMNNLEEGVAQSLSGDDVQVIVNTIHEYMKSFMLIGYDLTGNRVVAHSTKNAQDLDSLLVLCQQIAPNYLIDGDDELSFEDDSHH